MTGTGSDKLTERKKAMSILRGDKTRRSHRSWGRGLPCRD
jgi:hypothetical protein